jgi:molecular chaperone DnaK
MNTQQALAAVQTLPTTKPGTPMPPKPAPPALPPKLPPSQQPTQVLPPLDPFPPLAPLAAAASAFAPPPPPNVFTPPVPFEPPPPTYEPYDQPSPDFETPMPSVQPLSFVNPAAAFPEPLPPSRSAPVILEVTPRGLGIATVAGFCEELIPRNKRLPTEIKRVFATSRDRQPSVRIVVCQGESRRLDNNTIIGDLVLQNLPPRPRGETEIEVTFILDASGILQVKARDKKTGSEQRASLDLVGGVAQQDVAASRERIQQLRR